MRNVGRQFLRACVVRYTLARPLRSNRTTPPKQTTPSRIFYYRFCAVLAFVAACSCVVLRAKLYPTSKVDDGDE
jgi:hypothetical protein